MLDPSPTRPRDTSPEVWALQREIVSNMEPEARVRMAIELSEAVRQIQIEGLLARNPDWTPRDAVRHIVREQFGVELPERS